jgi:hypothetical protein
MRSHPVHRVRPGAAFAYVLSDGGRECRCAFIKQTTWAWRCSLLLANMRVLRLRICRVIRPQKCFRGRAAHLLIAQGSTAFPWNATPATSLWAAGDTKPTDRRRPKPPADQCRRYFGSIGRPSCATRRSCMSLACSSSTARMRSIIKRVLGSLVPKYRASSR